MLVELAGAELFAGLDDDIGFLLVEQSELVVGQRGGLLDAGQRPNQIGVDRDRVAGDREVFDRAQRVHAIVGIRRNLAVSEQIVLDTVFVDGHRLFLYGTVAAATGRVLPIRSPGPATRKSTRAAGSSRCQTSGRRAACRITPGCVASIAR